MAAASLIVTKPGQRERRGGAWSQSAMRLPLRLAPRSRTLTTHMAAAHGHARRLCSSASAGPQASYEARVASGELRPDDKQQAALVHLQRLHEELVGWQPRPPPPPPPPPTEKVWRGPQFDAYGQPTGGGTMYTGVANKDKDNDGGMWSAITSLFGGGGGGGGSGASSEPTLSDLESVPRGVYMYGGVGCGKSLLMDTFFDVAPVDPSRKRRVHFHEFMLEVHRRMHELRQASPEMGDPVPSVADDISSTTSLICFDEFQVTDVADALVMRRLFRYLFAHGLVLVATSNRRPDELYKNGIQRSSFLPFIADLEERCHAHDLASGTDYRTLAAVSAGGGTYLHPLGAETRAAVDRLFASLSQEPAPKPHTLRLRGRELHVPAAANFVARFSFAELCGKPLGAEDYIGISGAFHTVIVEDVPKLSLTEINQVRRLITMVDAFYDQHVRLILTAEVPAEQLFVPEQRQARDPALGEHGDLLGTAAYVPSAQDEVFAFDRTLSRLLEMRSHQYLVRATTPGAGAHALAVTNRVPAIVYEAGTALSKDDAAELFSTYDVDASGVLELAEIRMLMQDLSERRRGHRNVPEEEVRRAMDLMDSDGNGEISLYEFTDYIANTLGGNIRAVAGLHDSNSTGASADGVPVASPSRRISRSA